jgi:hypothetical protein
MIEEHAGPFDAASGRRFPAYRHEVRKRHAHEIGEEPAALAGT